MSMSGTIMRRRLEMLRDFNSPNPYARHAARAEWRGAAQEKALLMGMMANPMMWNPMGMAMIGGYATSKFVSNYARLSRGSGRYYY